MTSSSEDSALASHGRLEDYDSDRFGPLLGISDGGDAADAIVTAAAASAKAQVAGATNFKIGLILDAERMGSAGEVPVGPPEYAIVRQAALGRTYISTNVGVRANARNHQPFEEIAADSDDPSAIATRVADVFKRFTATPDGVARPVCVRLSFAGGASPASLSAIVTAIEALRWTFAGPETHRVGVLLRYVLPITTQEAPAITGWLDACAQIGVRELALDGPAVDTARLRLGVQSLLNIVTPEMAAALLQAAAARQMRLVYAFSLDIETIKRTIWAGLSAAQREGLHAAKYGLVPLTMSEQAEIIREIQAWFPDWTAVPAFYADTPLVTDNDVYLGDRMGTAAEAWLEMAASADAKLVLFDCPDRFVPRIDIQVPGSSRTMIKTGEADARGVFDLETVRALVAKSKSLGIRILWSGGIQPSHARELGRAGAAGFFTTGSTARQIAVGRSLARDPRLASQPAPTLLGVRRVHALAQAGFLERNARNAMAQLGDLDSACAAVLAAPLDSEALAEALIVLDRLLVGGWTAMWADERGIPA